MYIIDSRDDASVGFDLFSLIVCHQCSVTMRTLEDGSYLKMLESERLHVDLGCRDAVRLVGVPYSSIWLVRLTLLTF